MIAEISRVAAGSIQRRIQNDNFIVQQMLVPGKNMIISPAELLSAAFFLTKL